MHKHVGNKLKIETMKNITTIILIFITSFSFGQKKENVKMNYSEKSEIRVIHIEDSGKFHPESKPVGVFVNEIFIGNKSALETINKGKIESLNVEKKSFKINGEEYYGKIIVKMKSEYMPKFLTLKDLVKKHLDLNKNPIAFQINENVINQNYTKLLVDENFILKIILKKIKTSKKEVEINLIKLVTKTEENIEKANLVRIKGTEL